MSSPSIVARLHLPRTGFNLKVDLQLPGSGVTVFYGHSGSGKTTLLRCIAGLERAPHGEVLFKGSTWQREGFFLPTHKRPIGYVFQEASLFPHLTARQNLEFAMKRATPGVHGFDFQHAVQLLGITRILEQYPGQLSGGERQRVAIARALLVHPQLLLMDEPLASLDQARKQEILPYLEKLKRELDLPILYVSHSPDEVARLADYLVALDEGRVVAAGPLAETLSRLDFPIRLGEEAGTVLEARVAERDEKWQLARIAIGGGDLWFRDNGYPVGQKVRVRILARDISLALEHHDNTSITNHLAAEVMAMETDDHAGLALVKLKVGSDILVARVTRRSAHQLGLKPGKTLWAQIKSVAIVQ